MVSMYDVSQEALVEAVSAELKNIKEIKPTEWASFVKTGMSRERPPVRADWWYVRAASVLRIIAKQGPIGVSKLRTKYGSKKNRGVRPEHAYKASGNILRKILQQLEKAGLIKQVTKVKVHKGRIATPKGISILDKCAKKIAPAKKEIKKEVKSVAPEKVTEDVTSE